MGRAETNSEGTPSCWGEISSPCSDKGARMTRSTYKEPDHTGPEPSWWNMVIPFIIIIAAVILGYLGLV